MTKETNFNVVCYTGADSIIVAGVSAANSDEALVKGKQIIQDTKGIKPEQYLFRVFGSK